MLRIALLLVLLSSSIIAQSECLERTYGQRHLNRYPNQELRSILLSIKTTLIPGGDNDQTTYTAQGQLNVMMSRNNKLRNVNFDFECRSVPEAFLFNPYEMEVSKQEMVCQAKGKAGSFTLERIKNAEFDYSIKLDNAAELQDSATGENIKFINGDRVFRVKLDQALGEDTCQPVLFLPEATTTPRIWSEALLQSVRYDLARPTVTSRNLYHLSVLLWDVYASFDNRLKSFALEKRPALPAGANLQAERKKALSYAAYTFIVDRFKRAPGNVKDARPNKYEAGVGDGVPDETINIMLRRLMLRMGYDPAVTFVSRGFNAAEFGTLAAQQLIAKFAADGSRENENHAAPKNFVAMNHFGYLDVMQSGVRTPPKSDDESGQTKLGEEFADKYDINHWQPMYIPGSLDQNGVEVDSPQAPMTLFWGSLPTFSDLSSFKSNDKPGVYFDDIAVFPTFEKDPDSFILQNLKVLEASQSLGPHDLFEAKKDFDGDGVYDLNPGAQKMDISPKALGHNTLGTNDGKGYAVNPITSQPYAPSLVKRADYYRSLAEFWADGPRSETPPGHWNVIANLTIDDMVKSGIPLRWQGQGADLPREQFEMMLYVSLNGALYDAGIVAWGLKGHYQGGRPITVFRKLAKMAEVDSEFGRKLERLSPFLKMVTYDEVTTTYRDGVENEIKTQKTKLAAYGWRGPVQFGEIPNNRNTSFQDRDEPSKAENTFYSENGDYSAGVGWILLENWMPYQQQTFVTPPFPGFISGHSTFSRAAAEVMAAVTGSPYFPNGLGKYPAPALVFEGKADPFDFQWASYYDAADESGISRVYGGIHSPYDDIPGRKIGSQVGKAAFRRADDFFKGTNIF